MTTKPQSPKFSIRLYPNTTEQLHQDVLSYIEADSHLLYSMRHRNCQKGWPGAFGPMGYPGDIAHSLTPRQLAAEILKRKYRPPTEWASDDYVQMVLKEYYSRYAKRNISDKHYVGPFGKPGKTGLSADESLIRQIWFSLHQMPGEKALISQVVDRLERKFEHADECPSNCHGFPGLKGDSGSNARFDPEMMKKVKKLFY